MKNKHFAITEIEREKGNYITNGVNILIIFLTLIFFTNCSVSTKYEEQINKILDGDKSYGEFSDEQFDKVFEIIEKNPQTFEYNFSIPDESSGFTFFSPHGSKVSYMNFVESNDQQVRAYILERHGFGGNPSWGFETSTLIQYQIGGKIYTYRMTDTNSIIEEIAKLTDNKYIFIAFYGHIAQGEHNHNQARIYKFDENGVHLLPNVFEKKGKFVDEIEVYWESGVYIQEEFTDYEISKDPDEEDTDEYMNWGILYNWQDQNLYVANTREIDNHKLLDRTYKRYLWDGKMFKDDTIMSPYEVRNEDFYIRIEQNKDGTCTYKCWNGGIKSGVPNLMIRNGHREMWHELGFVDYNKWVSFDESSPLGERYTFTNNGYTYLYETGWRKGETLERLIVYAPNGDVVYSNDFDTVNQ